jgi:CHU_C Type IX secretion signal domain
MKKLLILLFAFQSIMVFAQAPTNDECQTAINLGKAPACPSTVFSNTNATKTDIGSNNNPFCPNDGNVDHDVWFSFVASDTIYDYSINIKSEATNGIASPSVNIYRGGCGKGNLIKICADSTTINSSEFSFNVYGLTAGETYYMRVSDINGQGKFKVCVAEIKSLTIDQGVSNSCAGILYDSGGPTGNYKANENYTFKICPSDKSKCIKLDFTFYNIDAAGDEIKIFDGNSTSSPLLSTINGNISKGANSGSVGYTAYAKSGCMTIQFKSDADVAFEGFEAQWQCSKDECTPVTPIVINNKATSQDIITSVSANGALVKLDTIICNKESYGTFKAGVNSDLGLGKGIVLSSGKVKDITKPLTTTVSTLMGFKGDSDLDKLNTLDTIKSNDACVVEFDVFASTDEINFEYIFGSEEYPEYVNSFNDIFAFMISGPGIVPDALLGTKKNMAILPNSTTPVEINSVNTNINWQYYRTGIGSTTYDGLTSDKLGFKKSLTARSTVTPCKTYRLKMAIADRGDSSFDSGVFVSEIKGAAPEISFVSPNKIDYLLEKCSGSNDKIKINLYKPLAQATSYVVKIGGTATNNVDYTFGITNTITFPAGATELSFPISVIADNIAEGAETITITLARDFGCGSVDLVTKTIRVLDQLEVKINAGADTVKVCSAGSGVQLLADGATFYTWAPASLFNNPQIPDPIVKATKSQYVYVLGQVGNCSAKDSIFIESFIPKIDIKALSNTSVCEGATIKLQAINNTKDEELAWEPNFVNFSNTSAPIVTIKANFTIDVWVSTQSGGCTAADTIPITVGNIGMPFVFPDTTVCEGYPVQLATQSFGSSTFKWTPSTGLSNANIANAVAKPKVNTQYILTGTSIDGKCSAKDTINIKVKVNNVTIQGPDTVKLCQGDSLVLNAIASGMPDGKNFKWTSKNTWIKNPTKLSTKGYVWKTGWVYAEFNGSGCLAKDSIFVIKDSLPSDLKIMAIKAEQPYCQGDTVLLYSQSILKPNYPKAQFQWSEPFKTAISPLTNVNLLFIAFKSGNYIRTITNGACVRKDTMKVNVLEVVLPTGLKDTSVCIGDKVQLNITNPKEYTEYEWKPGSGLSCTSCPNPIASQIGTYTFTGKVQGKCPASASMTITPKNKPLVVTPTQTSVCTGQVVNVPLSITSTGVTNIKWTPSSGLSCDNCLNPVATKTGTYNVEGIINTCKSTNSVSINELDTLVSLSKNGDICDIDQVLIALGASQNFSNFKWTPATGLSCSDCFNPKVTAPGIYTLTATKYGKCKATGKIEIKLSTKPKKITVTTNNANLNICKGLPVNIAFTVQDANTITGLSWTPSAGLSCNNCPTPVATAFNTYIVSGKIGVCNATDTISIKEITPEPLNITVPKLCPNSKSTISISNKDKFDKFKWTPIAGLNDVSISEPTASALGTYTVTAVSKTGNCPVSGTATVTAGTLPGKIKFAYSPAQLVSGDNQTITVVPSADNIDATKTAWSLSPNLNPIITTGSSFDINSSTFKTVGKYLAKVFSVDGCPATDTVRVYKVNYPLAFAPGTETKDRNNAVFQYVKEGIDKNSELKLNQLTIFNRWGNTVYSGKDDWNGKENNTGSDAPSDVYIYIAKFNTTTDETKILTIKGEVSLIR